MGIKVTLQHICITFICTLFVFTFITYYSIYRQINFIKLCLQTTLNTEQHMFGSNVSDSRFPFSNDERFKTQDTGLCTPV